MPTKSKNHPPSDRLSSMALLPPPLLLLVTIFSLYILTITTTPQPTTQKNNPPMAEAPKADLECSKTTAEGFRPDFDSFISKHPGKLKMLLLVRKDLGMGQGKIGAQCGHASMGAVTQYLVPHHELLMMTPGRVENPWDEDLQVYYAPEFGDSQDSDDEDDEEYSVDNSTTASTSKTPRTFLKELEVGNSQAEAAAMNSTAPNSAPGDLKLRLDPDSPPLLDGLLDNTPFSAPGDRQPHMNAIMESPAAQQIVPSIVQSTPPAEEEKEEPQLVLVPDNDPNIDPNDPATRYLRLTPREIRKELYGTEAPIQALMKHIIARWVWKGQAKIALKISSDAELSELVRTMNNNGIPYFEVYDAGLTQIAANTRTVVAVGPFPADILDPVFNHLKLL